MGYRNLSDCVADLEKTGQLVRVDAPIDPYLEVAEIQRRLYAAGGPAVLFTRPKGSAFPLLINLFGTLERARFLFRDTLNSVRKLVELKVDPAQASRKPWRYLGLARTLWNMRPKHVPVKGNYEQSRARGPVMERRLDRVDQLPCVVNWPEDGGGFITLPLVYSHDPSSDKGISSSNLGMYRVQLTGGQYEPGREVGLHYQIHRGIGVHHAHAVERGEPFRVNIFVGGPPAMTLAAVMPLPEGLSELMFAGALGGRRIRMICPGEGLPFWADADFCIVGTVDPKRLLPEGPFGDHLGYYSLIHDFPVLKVEQVYHRKDAIWPLTVVGRPPQEDTTFGALIHEITGPIIPTVLPGVKGVHAVDAAGVHPLLLAIGSERYTPYLKRQVPQELLTQANAILGQGQLSLAKYLLIVAGEDDPNLDLHDIAGFLRHLLERIDWKRDLHFQTRTTIDTLDYSGSGWNSGSKVVMAAVGPPIRKLGTSLPAEFHLPDGSNNPRIALPGVLVIETRLSLKEFVTRCETLSCHEIENYPLWVLVDDAEFSSRTLNNWLWVTFTRSNPASDLDGSQSSTEEKHWGCRGPLVIDARSKPHHAPPLIEDPKVVARVDGYFARTGPLANLV